MLNRLCKMGRNKGRKKSKLVLPKFPHNNAGSRIPDVCQVNQTFRSRQ